MLSPEKMNIIKVTSRTSLEKKLIRTLHDHSEIEFIDVEKKGLGSGVKISESGNEKEVFNLFGKVSAMVDGLDIISSKVKSKRNLEFGDLAKTLDKCSQIYEDVMPEYQKISSGLFETHKEIVELETLLETTKILTPLKVEFKVLGAGKYFSVFTGSIGTNKIERLEWNLKELTDDSVIFSSSSVEGEKGISALVVGALHKYRDDISRVLASFGFVELSIPAEVQGKPDEIQKVSKSKKSELEKQVFDWETKREQFIEKHEFDLLSVKEQLSIEKERIEAKRQMRQSKYVLQFWGYLPKSKLSITEDLVKSVDPDALFEIEEKEFQDDEYPTKMNNHKYIGKPYEELVIAFGTPDYKNDYDPSALFSITFPILFGIMFGDIFNGLLLILIGIYAMRMSPLGRQPVGMMEDMKNYLQKGGFLLFISGISSTIFGIFFWSFAGMHGHGAPSFMQEGGFLYFLKPLHLWSNDSETYELFAGATGSFLFLQLSLVIGIIHIGIALFMMFLNKIKHKHYRDAIFFPGMLLTGYISASLLVFSYSLDIFNWFSTTPKEFSIAVLTPFFGIFSPWLIPDGYSTGIMIPGFIVALIMTFSFLTFVVYEVILHGMDGFSEGLDFTLSLLGNSVSYARLFAINIVHSILALLVYIALGLEEKVPFDVMANGETLPLIDELIILIAFIIGTVIVMTFELMVTFLQTLRLHIVEFFSKMHYAGTGRAFAPFKSIRNYTIPVSLDIET